MTGGKSKLCVSSDELVERTISLGPSGSYGCQLAGTFCPDLIQCGGPCAVRDVAFVRCRFLTLLRLVKSGSRNRENDRSSKHCQPRSGVGGSVRLGMYRSPRALRG